MMATVGRNIAANAAGTGLGMAVLLAVVPIYLRLLGVEAYGLVGVFTTLMVASAALDLGLGVTINREVARLTARSHPSADGHDVAVTLEACVWAVGLGAGVLLAAAGPAIADHWLTFSSLTVADVRQALWLMAAALPALITRGFYMAGLNGLQRQSLANLVHGAGSIARAGVTVTALVLLSPTVTVFFVSQAALLHLETLAVAVALRRALPASARGGRVRLRALGSVAGFSAGVGGTMLLGFALTSLDQVVLSAILPLAEFGYYTLAVAAANAVGQLVHPVTTAVYPRFSQLVERGDTRELVKEYHFFSQLVAVLVLPLGGLLAFFPGELLTLWTRDDHVAGAVGMVLGLRAVGIVLNALLYVPHILQLASGWSSLGAGVNAVALVIVAPATVALSLRWGGVGAATVYVALNAAALGLVMVRMHRRLLPGELARWYGRLALPAGAVVAVVAVSRVAMPETLDTTARLAWLAATGALAAAAALTCAGGVRRRMLAAAHGSVSQ